jgi:glycosyl transferase, family 25
MRTIRVISLARSPQRRAEFLRRNAHVASSFFDAVDGRALTAGQIESSGAFMPELRAEGTYDSHAYGCALSHHRLWMEAAAGTEPLTIAEDDALLRRDFEARSAGVLATLPPGWDIVLWGWNFDSVLQVDPMGGVSPVECSSTSGSCEARWTCSRTSKHPSSPCGCRRPSACWPIRSVPAAPRGC